MGEQDSSLVSIFEDFFTDIYKEKINNLLAVYPTLCSLDVDFEDLDKFDTLVADQLITEPEIVIDAAEEAIRNMNLTLPPGVGEFRPHIRFYNGPNSDVMIERLSSKKLNELVSFKGIITKRTDVMHKVKKAHYVCQACGEEYNVIVTRNFKPPRMCASCKKLALIPNEEKSEFIDMQKAETQDLLEKVSGGAPAAKMELWFEDDLVNQVTPGENVQITGVMRIKPTQNLRQKNELVFGRYVEVIHVKSLKRDFEEITLTKDDIERVKEMASHSNITERISKSIAPAVYGYTEMKMALALQLFGGTKGKMMKGDAPVRDDIHVLLIGDPGIAKTRIMNSAVDLAPKSIYVSGKSVSGVGLCVGADSLVEFNDAGLWELGEYVESNFAKPTEEIPGAFSCSHSSKVASLGPSLANNFGAGTKIWRIKPPPQLVKLTTRRGKKITLTPQTPLLVFENGKINWKKSGELTGDEFIATSRSLPPLAGKQALLIELIDVPNLRIGEDVSSAMRTITDALKEKYGDLTKAAEKLGIKRAQLYEWRTKKYSRGIALADFKRLAKEANIPLAQLPLPSRFFIRYGKEISLPITVTPDLARFAGLIAADGDIYISKSGDTASVRFHNSDETLLKPAKALMKNLFGADPIRADDGKRVPCLRINSLLLATLLAALGVPSGRKSHKIDIPPVLVSCGKECMAAYLQALFDCDGWVSRPKNGSPSIGITTCSEKMARKVLLLLEWWGITATLRIRNKKGQVTFINGKRVESRHNQFQVEMRGAPNFQKFKKYIHFTSKKKRNALEALPSESENPNTDVVPVSDALSKIKQKYRLSARELHPQYCKVGKCAGRKKLRKIADALSDKPEAEWLRILSESDVYWDRIVSIVTTKPAKNEMVYDLTVEGSHAFWANGILVHNTASAEKDELGDGGWTLKAGALVLSSGGMAAIDEFDKIDEDDRASLHEVMESQSVSIAKAGIVAKFKAKTAIVAAANPKHGRFNQTKNLADQFDIPPSLLSRFDLIFPIIDVLDEEKDLGLAEHILSSHIEAAKGTYVMEEDMLDKQTLRKYIAYSRRYIHPILTNAAKDCIKEFYLDLRRKGKSSGSVPITPRYLEGLVRLAEAHAKMRLSQEVELADAKVATELLDYVLRKILTDQETGRLDVDIITSGKARSQIEKIESILDIIKEKTREQEAVSKQEVLEEAEAAGLDAAAAKRILFELQRKGEIYEKEPGWIALVGK